MGRQRALVYHSAPAAAPTKSTEKIREVAVTAFKRRPPLPGATTRYSRPSVLQTANLILVRYLIVPALLCLLLVSACKQEFGGERLFELEFAPQSGVVPAGVVAPNTWVIGVEPIATGFTQAMADNGVTTDDIDLVGGFRARVTSLDGTDFSDISRIELRACPRGQQFGCDPLQSLFSWSEFGGTTRRQALDLNPTNINAREIFLSRENIRLELVVTPFASTQVPLNIRVDWSVQAVGNLE